MTTTHPSSRGFTLIELLVAFAVFTGLMLAVMTAYTQGSYMSAYVRSNARIQDNVRLGMARLEQDLRMVGFGLPAGARVGGSDVWTPAIFHATATEIGFRGEIDGANTQIICSPRAANGDCPLDELILESVAFYDATSCKQPDDPGADLEVVVSTGDAWEPTVCDSVNVADGSIDVTAISDNTFTAGTSQVLTLEHVYYRFVPGVSAPYGHLERAVAYTNTPGSTFPPTSTNWVIVAEHLTDFWIEYRDESDATLGGLPLSASDRAAVSRILLYMEGFDTVGAQAKPQVIQVQSQVTVRNAGL